MSRLKKFHFNIDTGVDKKNIGIRPVHVTVHLSGRI
jgi:hypothetical protein